VRVVKLVRVDRRGRAVHLRAGGEPVGSRWRAGGEPVESRQREPSEERPAARARPRSSWAHPRLVNPRRFEGRQSAAREPPESRQRAAREPPESRAREALHTCGLYPHRAFVERLANMVVPVTVSYWPAPCSERRNERRGERRGERRAVFRR
jgi:hypothetical protein